MAAKGSTVSAATRAKIAKALRKVWKKKKLRHSAYIPDGLLPKSSSPKYWSEYRRLRLIYDPGYAAQIRAHDANK